MQMRHIAQLILHLDITLLLQLRHISVLHIKLFQVSIRFTKKVRNTSKKIKIDLGQKTNSASQ